MSDCDTPNPLGRPEGLDGWGQPIQYQVTSANTFELRSSGRDKVLGSLDDVANVRTTCWPMW